MSLFALPVTAADIAQLEEGIQFFQTSAANQAAVAAGINAPGSTSTVFTYAASLLNANLSFSQVAMATTALMLGATASTATLDNISTNFLPAQVQNAINNGFNPTVYAAEATGLALGGEAAFQSFVGLNVAQFSQQVSTLTGVNQAAIQGFVANWVAFYTANPAATQGLTITQAAYGAAFGDAAGVALLNPTTANLQTVISTNAAFPFSPNTVSGLVANALILNGELLYTPGTPTLAALPQHTLLQGEAGQYAPGTFSRSTSTMDDRTSTPTSLQRRPSLHRPGGTSLEPSNTLNAGDNLGGTVGDGDAERHGGGISVRQSRAGRWRDHERRRHRQHHEHERWRRRLLRRHHRADHRQHAGWHQRQRAARLGLCWPQHGAAKHRHQRRF